MGYLQDSEDSVSLPQLLDMGLSLTSVLPGGEHPLAMAAQHPLNWEAKIGKMNDLLNAGVQTDAWKTHDGFRATVLKYVFDAEFRLASPTADRSQASRKFTAGVHTDQVLNLLAYPLKHGLDVSQSFKLNLWQGQNYLFYRGSLLGAIALLLCGRHSELRPWCVPMVRLLLAHATSGDADAEAVDTSTQVFASYGALQLTGRWQAVVGPFKRTAKASVLERLMHRQTSEGEDAIDTQVIELLQARHA